MYPQLQSLRGTVESNNMKEDQLALNIRVALLNDNEEISFGAINLYHSQCVEIPMSKHRNVVSDEYMLQCVCGLELTFPTESDAKEKIIKVAVGGTSAFLERDSFGSNQEVASIELTSA